GRQQEGGDKRAEVRHGRSGDPRSRLTVEGRGRMKKLWRVTIEYEVVVAADTEMDAFDVAYFSPRDILEWEDRPDLVNVTGPIQSPDALPKGWKDCIPYGGDGNTRVEAYFES